MSAVHRAHLAEPVCGGYGRTTMANIQKQLQEFDEKIRLKRFDENATLREKRDAVLTKLRARFDVWRKDGRSIPTFSEFNQGSYAMGTGIQPADGDYDIDVGLRFNAKKTDYPNPVDLKILVADALEGHTELGTDVRRSCVTVKYKIDGEQAYHVDLAIYAYDDPESPAKRLFLAKGKRGSDQVNRWWEESDPLGLVNRIDAHYADKDDEAQFLRVIRALKRWKTEKFKTEGNNAPSGVGLTIAALNLFRPVVSRDALAKSVTSDDRSAMRTFVNDLIGQFRATGRSSEAGEPMYRVQVALPVAPWKDIFERMTDGQMTTFRDRLVQLRDALDKVANEADPVVACKAMRKEFGDEFPVPEKQDTGESRGRAISSSGVSA